MSARDRHFSAPLRLCVSLVSMGLASSLTAAQPAWWTTGNTAFIDPAASHDLNSNYSPASQGQLKQVATKAALYLNTALPSPGAGAAVNSLVGSFQHTNSDYSPINIGQLKVVAKPFYDRLLEVGYNTKANLIAQGYPSNWAYDTPWDPNTPTSENYSPANIGQVKVVFSFDLTQDGPDALPDWWERLHFSGTTGNDPDGDADGDGFSNLQEYQQGSDPQDFWNGQPPVLVKVSGDGLTNAPGAFVALPLTVRLQNAQGAPFAGGAVTYTVTQGGGTLQTNNSSSASATASRSTDGDGDGDGQVRMYFRLPSLANNTSTIVASFAVNGHTATATFTETSGAGGTAQTSSPFNPLNMQGVINADGSQDVTWENNPDSTQPVKIWLMEDNGTWTYYATAPAGATSYHIPPQ